MFSGMDMLNAPFYIGGYDTVDNAIAAFKTRGLLNKEFTTKLDKGNIYQQLSDFLVLCKLLYTVEDGSRYKDSKVKFKVNNALKHYLVCDSHEFIVKRRDEYEYVLSTSFGDFDAPYGDVDAVIGVFWDMVIIAEKYLDKNEYQELFRKLYNENYAVFVDYKKVVGVWTAVEDLEPSWYSDAEIFDAHTHPSRTIEFKDDGYIVLGGSLCGTIKTNKAKIDPIQNVICLDDIVLARIQKFDGVDLEIEYFYYYDWWNDGIQEIPSESIREFIKKNEDSRTSKYRFNRLEQQM